MTKIMVSVYGGVVNAVHCSDPEAEVEIVDYDDNPEAVMTGLQLEAAGLKQVY